jgi:hypothetical protein
VHAYPVGLLTIALAAALFLLTSLLAPIALALVFAPIGLLSGGDALVRAALAAVPAVRRTLAPTAGLAVVFGLLLHGPTEDLASRAYGDMLYYVNKISSAAESIAPFRDLLVEGEEIIYAEAAPSFVGAALSWLPPVDPILFHTTSLVAFLCASLTVGCALLAPGRTPPPGAIVTIALVATASVIYPTWLVESPPVTMALPLAFSVYRLWAAPPATPTLIGLGAVVAVDLLLTKVVALLVVGILGLFVLAERYRDRVAAMAVGVALGAAAVAAFLVATAGWYAALLKPGFLPIDAARGIADQINTRNAAGMSPAFEIVGQCALLVALARARAFQLLTAAVAAVAGVWLIAGQSFDIALATAVLISALLFWRDPRRFARARVPLTVAASSFAVAIWLRDISGVHTTIALLALTVGLFVAAFGFRRSAWVWALGAAGIAATLVERRTARYEVRRPHTCRLHDVARSARTRAAGRAGLHQHDRHACRRTRRLEPLSLNRRPSALPRRLVRRRVDRRARQGRTAAQ